MMNFINNMKGKNPAYSSTFRPLYYNNKIHDYQDSTVSYGGATTQYHYLVMEPIHITAPILIFDEDRIDEKVTPRKAHATPRKTQNVTFNQTKNKTVYINGKDFYKQNNTKQSIWWSQHELAFIRNMFTIEVQREWARCPHKSQRDCMLDLIAREV